MRIAAGAIHIIAGIIGLCVFTFNLRIAWPYYFEDPFSLTLTIWGTIPILLTIVSSTIIIIAGVLDFRRRRWRFVLEASILYLLATVSWWFSWSEDALYNRFLFGIMCVGWILGILSVVLAILSKKEFIRNNSVQHG